MSYTTILLEERGPKGNSAPLPGKTQQSTTGTPTESAWTWIQLTFTFLAKARQVLTSFMVPFDYQFGVYHLITFQKAGA